MIELADLLGTLGAAILPAMEKAGIESPLEKSHFLAQLAQESAGFTRLIENLNYGVDGLRNTWPGRFPSIGIANGFARQPEKIANFVYASRLGNGPIESGDGWTYRGRGFIQTTGRSNYADTSQALFGDHRLIDYPELLQRPENAANAACHFWQSRHLSIPAMKDDLVGVTRGVNGGTTGLAGRAEWLRKFKAALGVPA